MPIGPTLPPHLQNRSTTPESGPSLPTFCSAYPPPEEPDSEDDANDFGPALPPHLAALRKSKPTSTSGPSPSTAGISSREESRKPIVGPSRPAPELLDAAASSVSRSRYQVPDEEDSDDEVGPKFVPGNGEEKERSAVEIFMEREARWAKEREEAAKPKEMKREEWMLVPPEAGDLAAATDPLRKRPTTFNRTSTPAITSKDQTLWTETPAEKLQRISDEVAGKKRKADVGVRVSVEEEEEARRKRKRDKEIKKSVERHNDSHRAASLLEIHAKAKKDSKDEEKPPAIWDRDRDMGVTGRLLSDPERLQKIKDARGLNDRFGHGKAGAFSM